MEERKWEDLEFDCLVNVLGRVDMESLLLYVPFVCKSWYKASLNPSCWKHLVFPTDVDPEWDLTLIEKFKVWYDIHKCSLYSFIKFVVGLSHGNCTGLSLPDGFSEEVLKYIADECPALISLSLPVDHFQTSESLSILPTLIGKWEHLENLRLGSSDNLVDIITQISLACSKFSSLGVSIATIGEKEASAIVTYLPNIKSLILRGAQMDLKSLVIILHGCRNLVHLDVRNCTGFNSDEWVLELAPNIKTFMCEGSMRADYDDYDVHGHDYFYECFDG
ncbi:hypothetical protein OIU78_020100 [Salix suchowensis]|nr:F-box/LRR-repeat protein [Salix suchowensis]KAJ6316942.1 hypothetical protein OIU78_020100 [Salix suchowensis]